MDLEQLKSLSDLKYRKSQQALSQLLISENSLRTEIIRLRTLTRETQTQPMEQAQMRMIGGDVIWLKWLGKAQHQLNTELAQILAQKEALMTEHQKTSGRKMVAEHLADQDIKARHHSKQKAQMEGAINHTLLR